jgi:hypothetical protein
MPTSAPRKWYQRFDYKDFFAVIGLGLMGWGLERIGGRTALIFYLASLALVFSGLFHMAVQYAEFHFAATVRAITTTVPDDKKKES